MILFGSRIVRALPKQAVKEAIRLRRRAILSKSGKNRVVKYSSCGFEDVDDDLPVLLLLKSGFRDSFFVSSFNRDNKCFEQKTSKVEKRQDEELPLVPC